MQFGIFSQWLDKPVYCNNGTDAGNPTNIKTDAFLGWFVGQNTIRLALDLRNEASSSVYGTTRYATTTEVRDSKTLTAAAARTAVTPETLNDNYLQTTWSNNINQAGYDAAHPILVNTHVKFNTTLFGEHVAPTNNVPAGVDFYGAAYQAMWADLAEYYEADKYYEPGTLITCGGEKEITAAITEVNGVISSKPGYLLGKKNSDNTLPVALCGRVPVLFDGNCLPKHGDKVYLSTIKHGYESTIPNGQAIGKIIEIDFGTKKLLECVVKITF